MCVLSSRGSLKTPGAHSCFVFMYCLNVLDIRKHRKRKMKKKKERKFMYSTKSFTRATSNRSGWKGRQTKRDSTFPASWKRVWEVSRTSSGRSHKKQMQSDSRFHHFTLKHPPTLPNIQILASLTSALFSPPATYCLFSKPSRGCERGQPHSALSKKVNKQLRHSLSPQELTVSISHLVKQRSQRSCVTTQLALLPVHLVFSFELQKSANRHKTYKAASSTVIQQLFGRSTHSSHHCALFQQWTMVLCSVTPPTDTFNLFEMALFITGHLSHRTGKSLPSSRVTFEPNKMFYEPLSHLKNEPEESDEAAGKVQLLYQC